MIMYIVQAFINKSLITHKTLEYNVELSNVLTFIALLTVSKHIIVADLRPLLPQSLNTILLFKNNT